MPTSARGCSTSFYIAAGFWRLVPPNKNFDSVKSARITDLKNNKFVQI